MNVVASAESEAAMRSNTPSSPAPNAACSSADAFSWRESWKMRSAMSVESTSPMPVISFDIAVGSSPMSVGRMPLPIELPSAPHTTWENVARR